MSDNKLDLEAFEKLDLTVDSAKARKARADALRIAAITPKEIFDRIQERYDRAHENSEEGDTLRTFIFLKGEIDLDCPEFLALRGALLKHEVIEDVILSKGTSYSDTTLELHIKNLTPKPPAQIEKKPEPLALPAPQKKRRWWDFGGAADDTPQLPPPSAEEDAISQEETTKQRNIEMAEEFRSAATRTIAAATKISAVTIDTQALETNVGKITNMLEDDSVSFNRRPLAKARMLVSDLAETFARHAKMDNLDKQAISELETCFRQVTQQMDVLAEQATMPERLKAEVERSVLMNMTVK